MKIYAHLKIDDTAYVSIFASKAEIESLRDFMHTPKNEKIEFPRSVVLHKRGFGWYRLEARWDYNAIAKIQYALKIIRNWQFQFRKEQRRAQAEARILQNPNLQVVSYHSDLDVYTTRRIQIQPDVLETRNNAPSAAQLAALAAKFGR